MVLAPLLAWKIKNGVRKNQYEKPEKFIQTTHQTEQPKIWRLPLVNAYTGLSRSTIYLDMKIKDILT